MNNPSTGTRIVPPPDFPVAWQQPEEADLHWTRDREHMPDPITPMFYSAAGAMAIEVRQRTVACYDEAIAQRFDRPIHYYNYTALLPYQGPREELESRGRRNRAKVVALALRLDDVWEREWRPALEAQWAFWAAFDLERADMAALRDHLEESIVRGARLYELHYRMGPPMWLAIDEFEALHGDLFPGTTRLDAHRLLRGWDNKTLEAGRALWRLRDLARAWPRVDQLLTERPAGEIEAALAAFPEGLCFLAELRAFLATYGRRSSLWDWGYPSWEDDPTPVLNNLKSYLAQPDRDLQAELRATAAEREAAVAAARQALAAYPVPVVERFERWLAAAQRALVLTEDHTYYIDFNGFGWIHRVIREFGKRFAAAGRLESPDDVFYLTLDELRALGDDPALDHRALAASRRVEIAHWAQYDEPLELGTRPAEPLYLYSPDARRTLRYVGGWATETPPPEPADGVLHGQAGSPGKVRGRARLIRTLAESHRLQPGDILVTRTTAPPWTPLFLTAAAVVTDAGGLLSHGAVVSREYRIPAVVGARLATTFLRDGQMIEVDGDQGLVRLLAA